MYEDNRIKIPEELGQVVENSLRKVKKIHRRKVFCKVCLTAGACAAAITLLLVWGFKNPAMASKLPAIGHLFSQIEKDVSYKGNFSSKANILLPEDKGSRTDSPYIQESNGITISVTETYCNNLAVYLAVEIYNEEAFPDDFMATKYDENYIDGYDVLRMDSIDTFSFDSPKSSYEPFQIQGNYKDAHTFIGIIRAETGAANFRLEQDTEVPETFQYELNISSLSGYIYSGWVEDTYIDPVTGEEGICRHLDGQESKVYKGNWNFKFDLKIDPAQIQTVTLNDVNDKGVGIKEVVKTPFEITATYVHPEGTKAYDYALVICDANGDFLDFQGENTRNTYQTYERNTDTVSIFLFENEQFWSGLVQYYWAEDYETKRKTKTFAEYLEEHALYSTHVDFTDK